MIERVNDRWVQTHGDYRQAIGERFLPALPEPKRPWYRLPLCLTGNCGGRIESDHVGAWWQCNTCQRVKHYMPRAEAFAEAFAHTSGKAK